MKENATLPRHLAAITLIARLAKSAAVNGGPGTNRHASRSLQTLLIPVRQAGNLHLLQRTSLEVLLQMLKEKLKVRQSFRGRVMTNKHN